MKRRDSLGPSISFFAFQDIITAVVGIFILITLILVLELAQRVEAASSAPTADTEAVIEAIAALEIEIMRLSSELERRMDAQAVGAELNAFNRQGKTEQARKSAETATQQLASMRQRLDESKEMIEAAEKEAVRLLLKSAELEDERSLLGQLADKLRQVQDEINRIESDESPIYRDVTEQGRFLTLLIMADTRIELRDALTKTSSSWKGARRLDEFRNWLAMNELSKRQMFVVIKPGAASDFEAIKTDLERSGAVYGFTVIGRDREIQLGFETKALP